jgi:hypothetical protein
MTTKKHQWNTGRQYANDGQRMVAEVHETEIMFSDLSRYINGSIPLGKFKQGRADMSKYDIEALVMNNYDFGNYSGSGKTLEWEEKR